ncbi:hypothetical protein MMC27_006700 [Xylographa pallens]|nr:hypothetical protein [Xylographa pallens]
MDEFLPQMTPNEEIGQYDGLYVNVVDVPKDPNSSQFNECWNVDDVAYVRESVAMENIRSTARSLYQHIWKAHGVALFRAKKPCFHYRAMDFERLTTKRVSLGVPWSLLRKWNMS